MILPARFFVTGTDTEVGKTVITACLAASAPGARALKPVASGVPEGQAGEDEALLAYAAGHDIPEGAVHLLAPLSPHRAAMLEGRVIQPEGLLAWIAANLAPTTIVEGVGGWEVPITPDFRVADLAERLAWPVLIVAADRLGVLNHTLLTVNAIRARGLSVCGVVLNGAAPSSNLTDLRMLLPGVPVRYQPRLPDLLRPTLAAAGRLLRTRRHVALIVPMYDAPEGPYVFLQHRDRYAPIHPNRWGFFGGHVEPGEDAEAAMLREAFEELELVPRGYQKLDHQEEPDVIRDIWTLPVTADFAQTVVVHEGEGGAFHLASEAAEDARLVPSLRGTLLKIAMRAPP